MVSELVNVSMGMRANGSCRLINTFNMSFIMVRSCIPENVATRIVGKIAMLRVNKTRTQRFHLRFKKPYIKKKKKIHEILSQELQETICCLSTFSLFSSTDLEVKGGLNLHLPPLQTALCRYQSWLNFDPQPEYRRPKCTLQLARTDIPETHPEITTIVKVKIQ